MNDIIRFERTDHKVIKFVSSTESIVKFLLDIDNTYLNHFCNIVIQSYDWNYSEIIDNVRDRCNVLSKKRKKDGNEEKYVEAVIKYFQQCKNINDLRDLRGIFPEILLEQVSRKNINSSNEKRFWRINCGCNVIIHGNKVVYSDKNNQCSKTTVDLGLWNIKYQKGHFFEVKVSPYSYKEVDDGYITMLINSLKKDNDIKEYAIYLYTLYDKSVAKEKFNDINKEIVVLGRFDILKNIDFNQYPCVPIE